MTTSFLSFSSMSFDGVVSTAWWISLVAFHTRNRPPAMRIRSRQEKAVSKVSPWKPRSKTGAVRPTIQPMVARRPRRMISARPMPMRRVRWRCSGGSLFDRIEMKIRLSIPSTISMTTRVTRAAQAAGSVSSGVMLSSIGVPDGG
ncbi:hypothetical protein D9M72_599370 [compost metagenome]